MPHRNSVPFAVLMLSACNVPATDQAGTQDNGAVPGVPMNGAVMATPARQTPPPQPPSQPSEAPAPGKSGGLPDDRAHSEDPSGPIDPKSAEGAGYVVQIYGALLERRKFAEARKSWGGEGEASGLSQTQFIAAYDRYSAIHSEVGKPADSEGAAGSIYITVPFHLYGTVKSGQPFNLIGPLTLRRVNDVTGSTQAQRRWHIVESGMKPRP